LITTRHPATDELQARPRTLLPRQASEKEFAKKVIACIEPWFKIEEQVTGTHTLGTYVRIDALARPVDPSGWFDKDPAFGIEFKQLPQDISTRDPMTLAAQAIDYTYVPWLGYGRVGVFMCTPDQGAFPVNGGRGDPNFPIAHLLGQFAVGELCHLKGRGWTLLKHGWHVLWSERYGVEEAKRQTIRPKVGSR
jgi:hypothetical protein